MKKLILLYTFFIKLQQKKETHRPSRWFFSSGCNPNGASERLKGV